MKLAMQPFVKQILLLVVLALAAASGMSAQGRSIAVVVSSRNSSSSLSVGELRKIFSGEKRNWPDGTKVKLISRAPGTLERSALLKLLGKSEAEYKQYWTGKVYQGDADSEPLVLPSVGMQKEALNAYPGAIALFDHVNVKPGMKVLKIDGKMPEDSGYPLTQ